jgi:hypothetical protein
VELHGVKVQDEHLVSNPNRWTNQKSELGYLTKPKELCGDASIRLGGHLELAKFCYNNLEHSTTGSTPFQMVTGKSPMVLTT